MTNPTYTHAVFAESDMSSTIAALVLGITGTWSFDTVRIHVRMSYECADYQDCIAYLEMSFLVSQDSDRSVVSCFSEMLLTMLTCGSFDRAGRNLI